MSVTWREDEPRLTAADVEATAFPRTPWGRRGYDEATVDVFLGQVRDELMMCANEATGLRDTVADLRVKFMASRRGEVKDWLADATEAHKVAVSIVSEAQVTADRYVAAAQEYSARLTRDATVRREAMLAEAEQVLADARGQAAAAASAAMEEPVPDQVAGPLRAARASDAYARTFNKVYLSNAIVVTEALLKMLDDWQAHEAGDEQGDAQPAGERAR